MFLLCILSDENQLDAMPVIKTTQYPWADSSYRPLSYGRLAYLQNKGLLVDLQAFERDPALAEDDNILAGSCVAFSIRAADTSPMLTVVLDADGRHLAYRDGHSVDASFSVNTYAGVDEQGWYWGVRFYVDHMFLQDYFGISRFLPEQHLFGTIYKFSGSADGDIHIGSAAPMTDRSILSPRNLGDITVIRY